MNRTVAFIIFPAIILLLLPFSTALGQEYTTEDLDSVPRLRWMGPQPPVSHEQYMAGRTIAPFQVNHVADVPGGSRGKALVVVNQDLRPAIAGNLDRYLADLAVHGYQVELHESLGGTAPEMKSFILDNSENLVGVVFVGDMPVPWFEMEHDFGTGDYADFPCDLYYMELDGTWSDTDSNGKFDLLVAGDGDQGPEIFVGHIDASMMSGNEAEMVNAYFDRNHDWWSGTMTCTAFGLTYTEDDWAYYEDMRHDIQYAYPDHQAIYAPDTHRDDYVDTQLPDNSYEFIQLACHSWSEGHAFTRGGNAYSSEVRAARPRAIFYNLFCCSASRWIEPNHLGGAYIFNESGTALATLGSSKTGSMLTFWAFYQPFGQGNSLGESFRIWFDHHPPYDPGEWGWFGGMTICGDPFLENSPPDSRDLAVLAGPGPLPGQDPRVRGYSTAGTATALDFDPLPELSGYGVNLSVGDIDGDGAMELITAGGPGPQTAPLVRAFEMSGVPLAGAEVTPYGVAAFGANVAAGDLDGDGRDEIVTGAGPGPMFGPHVRGFRYQGGHLDAMSQVNYLAYGTNKYGVNVACGDFNGDGRDEIVTGAGPGSVFGPHVRGWHADGAQTVPATGVSFFAYNTLKYGVNVTCGDLDGDGVDEIVTGAGPGRVFGSHVRGWSVGGDGVARPMNGVSFIAYGGALLYGVRVSCADLDGDGRDELVTAPGPGATYSGHIRGFRFNGTEIEAVSQLDFIAFAEEGYRGGATVAAVPAIP